MTIPYSAAPIAATLVGASFLWSGALKLRDPELTAFALIDNGLIRRFSARHGYSAGAVEVALGALTLLSIPLGKELAVGVGATDALLLIFFLVLIGRRIHRGDSGTCGCFSQREGRPVGAEDIMRSGLLAALAILALAGAFKANDLSFDDSLFAWLDGFSIMGLATLVATSWAAIGGNREGRPEGRSSGTFPSVNPQLQTEGGRNS